MWECKTSNTHDSLATYYKSLLHCSRELSSNELICDCQLRWLVDYLDSLSQVDDWTCEFSNGSIITRPTKAQLICGEHWACRLHAGSHAWATWYHDLVVFLNIYTHVLQNVQWGVAVLVCVTYQLVYVSAIQDTLVITAVKVWGHIHVYKYTVV